MKSAIVNVETLFQITRELRYVITGRFHMSFRNSDIMYQVMIEEINELSTVLKSIKITIDDVVLGTPMHHYVTRIINRLEENCNSLMVSMSDKTRDHRVIELILELHGDAHILIDIINMVEQSNEKAQKLLDQQEALKVKFIVDDTMAKEDDSMPVIKRPVKKG